MKLCRARLHDLDDPFNATVTVRDGRKVRECRPCGNERVRRRYHATKGQPYRPRQLEWRGPRTLTAEGQAWRRRRQGVVGYRSGGQLAYKVTPSDVRLLQSLADGFTAREIAVQEYVTLSTIRMRSKMLMQRLGVSSSVGAVAQGLKRGMITPDKVTAKRLRLKWNRDREPYRLRYTRRQLADVVNAARMPGRPGSVALYARLAPLEAMTEPHAVSIMWALGEITSRHVPQTRNAYRGFRNQQN